MDAKQHLERLQKEDPDKALDVLSHVESIHNDIKAELKRRIRATN